MKHQWEYEAITKQDNRIKWCGRCGCIKDGDDIVAPYGTDGDGAGVKPCTTANAMAIRDKEHR